MAKRTVLMPTYAQDADDYGFDRHLRELLDEAAGEVWESLGFEVRRMDGVEDLAMGWGAVHCIHKSLSRSHYEES